MTRVNRRAFIRQVTSGAAAFAATGQAGTDSRIIMENASTGVQSPERNLADPAFRPLPLGSISPQGWLRRQLRLQADGLSGHLDEFWPDVGQSQWLGGKAEGWERAPYWLDGVLPLAWQLDDAPLKKRIAGYVDYIVAHQRADGWFGPYPMDAVTKRYDMWAILLANKVLVQFHEATGDARVLRAVEKSLRAMQAGMDRTPLYNWGSYRWFEGLVAVFYVYERTGETWLLDLGRKLRVQGFDYAAFYRGEDVTVPTPRRGLWKWGKHVVNTGMAAKSWTAATAR